MKKTIIIILAGTISAFQTCAQPDCFFKYCYTGEVVLNEKNKASTDIVIQLPSPELFLNIVAGAKGFIQTQISGQLSFKKQSTTIGSSFFCGTPEYIIAGVLKAEIVFYPVYIINEGKKIKKEINIKDITFSHKDGIINIALPIIIL